jgi:hypothetical protein
MDKMIEFKIEVEKTSDYDAPTSPSKREYYPSFYVEDMKEDDDMKLGEWCTVTARIKKVSSTVRECEKGKKYSCTYEVAGFVKPESKVTDFAQALEELGD